MNKLSVRRFALSALTIAEMEARKIRHNSSELWIRAVQPALWLIIFGEALSRARGIAPAGFSYIQFITPGVLAQSVLFVAIFYGITLVWERDLGLLNKLLSTPSPRPSIITGKALAAGIRGVFQAVVVFALALIIGANVRSNLFDMAGVFAVVILLSMFFSSLSMFLASFMKTRERMMGLGQVITMPLFFASNAIYPLSLMPSWLQTVAAANPLSYAVDAMRAMLLTGDYTYLPVDILVLASSTAVFITLASIALNRIVK